MRLKAAGSANLRPLKGCCSNYVQARMQWRNAEMKLDRDNLSGDGDNRDWPRDKALHIHIDRTTVNSDVRKAERSVFI